MNPNTKLLLKVTFCVAILFLIYCLVTKSYFTGDGKPLREGVTFTHFDNSTFFTKPWDEFCVNPPPSSNNNNFMEKPAVLGLDPVGNWCKNYGEALSPPSISAECFQISNDH